MAKSKKSKNIILPKKVPPILMKVPVDRGCVKGLFQFYTSLLSEELNNWREAVLDINPEAAKTSIGIIATIGLAMGNSPKTNPLSIIDMLKKHDGDFKALQQLLSAPSLDKKDIKKLKRLLLQMYDLFYGLTDKFICHNYGEQLKNDLDGFYDNPLKKKLIETTY